MTSPRAAGLLGEIARDDPLGFLGTDATSVVNAAYRFCRHEPGVDVVLTGTGNRRHLEENVRHIQDAPLPDAALAKLAALFGGIDSVSGN